MAPSSNEERAVKRIQCREVLSKYICKLPTAHILYGTNTHRDRKLGIQIPPDQIRLPSRPADPYVWSYHPSKEHLFSAPLSRGTISVYDEICNELDHSIEVVQRASPCKDHEAHQAARKVVRCSMRGPRSQTI